MTYTKKASGNDEHTEKKQIIMTNTQRNQCKTMTHTHIKQQKTVIDAMRNE